MAQFPPIHPKAWRIPDQAPGHVRSIGLELSEFWRDTDSQQSRDCFRVHGIFSVGDGELLIRRVVIEPSPWIQDGESLRKRKNEEEPAVHLFDLADHVNLRKIIREVRDHLASLPVAIRARYGSDPEVEETVALLDRMTRPAIEARPRPGPKGHSPDELAAMALDCIEEARSQAGGGHHRHLASKWYVTEQTVKVRIARLRKEGWLAEGARGRFVADPGPALAEWQRARKTS